MKITFKKDRKDFHKAVVHAVNTYFESVGNNRKATGHMYFKTAFFSATLLAGYACMLVGGYSVAVSYFCWIVIGLSSVFLTVNCGHDAIHGAYSRNNGINRLMSRSFDLLGANSYLWSITHNIVHHTYTSIEGEDEDVRSVPFTRLTPFQERKSFHRYQHIYIFFLYAFATLFWVVVKDYKKFFQKQIGQYKSRHPFNQYVNLFIFKLIYYAVFLVIPILVVDMPWYLILGGFLISHLFEGFVIALIFALAHIVEEAHFFVPDEAGTMENNWAVHQMYTTVDFGRKSRLTTFLTGGLNFQIEHHLFPSVCHVHYPVISEIIKSTAMAHNIPYNECPSFLYAVTSHIRHLKKLGSTDDNTGA